MSFLNRYSVARPLDSTHWLQLPFIGLYVGFVCPPGGPGARVVQLPSLWDWLVLGYVCRNRGLRQFLLGWGERWSTTYSKGAFGPLWSREHPRHRSPRCEFTCDLLVSWFISHVAQQSCISDPQVKRADRSQGFVGLNAALLKSTACGCLILRSLDPTDAPQCKLNYLSTSEDKAALRAALRLTVEIAKNMRDAGYPIEETCAPASLEDACLDSFIRDKAETMFHYSSTCRMAPLDDLHPGVVDDELIVHGIVNLRIADASIFPSVPGAHLQALVYAVAEKCADMMVKRHRLPSQPEGSLRWVLLMAFHRRLILSSRYLTTRLVQ